jgi:hypothetical protein
MNTFSTITLCLDPKISNSDLNKELYKIEIKHTIDFFCGIFIEECDLNDFIDAYLFIDDVKITKGLLQNNAKSENDCVRIKEEHIDDCISSLINRRKREYIKYVLMFNDYEKEIIDKGKSIFIITTNSQKMILIFIY